MQGAGDINRMKKDLVIPGGLKIWYNKNCSCSKTPRKCSKSPYTTVCSMSCPTYPASLPQKKRKGRGARGKKNKENYLQFSCNSKEKHSFHFSHNSCKVLPAKNGSRESFRSSIPVQLCFYSIQNVWPCQSEVIFRLTSGEMCKMVQCTCSSIWGLCVSRLWRPNKSVAYFSHNQLLHGFAATLQ